MIKIPQTFFIQVDDVTMWEGPLENVASRLAVWSLLLNPSTTLDAFRLGCAQIRPISGRSSARMLGKKVELSALLPRINLPNVALFTSPIVSDDFNGYFLDNRMQKLSKSQKKDAQVRKWVLIKYINHYLIQIFFSTYFCNGFFFLEFFEFSEKIIKFAEIFVLVYLLSKNIAPV